MESKKHSVIFQMIIIILIVICSGCGSLRQPIISYSDGVKINDYTYFYVTPTAELTSGSILYGDQYGIYSSGNKTINPSDVISGILLKHGFIKVNEVLPENASKTMIVNYGESGRRSLNLGYTIEVTIQFTSADTQSPIVTCTAEGQGSSEADDIRLGIVRALDALFEN